MILENTNTFQSVGSLEVSQNFLGDASELAEMQISAFHEMHNLTVALARFEHRCITESSSPTLIQEGVKEFFSSIGQKIKEWWNRFVAWLGSLWTRLRDLFVKREDWLKRNKVALLAKTDSDLSDIEIELGTNALSTKYADKVSELINVCEKTLNGLQAASIGPKRPEDLKDMLLAPLKRRDAAKAIAKEIHDDLVGEKNEKTRLSKSLVAELVAGAENTYLALDRLKGAKVLSAGALKAAEGFVRMDPERRVGDDGDAEKMKSQLQLIQAAGPIVQQIIAGTSSAISAANGQFMSGLVKAAGAKAKSQVQNNSGDLLAAFM